MRALFFLALAILVGGCTSETVYVRHLETGAVVQCGPYTGGPANRTASLRYCVGAYQQQGYVRVPAP